MYPQLEDEDNIVLRLQEQDPLVLADIYDRYGRMVYSVVLRYVRNRATAEDLTQETFLRVWNRADTFDGTRGQLSSWILVVAKNSAIDFLRSSEGRTGSLSINLSKLEGSCSLSVVPSVDKELSNAEQLQGGFVTLSEAQMKIVQMAYYEGFTQAEIAVKLGRPLGTVKSCLRAALKNLRMHLALEREPAKA